MWVAVPTDDTALIQELHVTIGHCLCDALDRRVRRAFAPASPVVTLQEAGALRAAWRAAGETVVWTNGCFDLLHVGHVASLRAARALGDRLIVGLNDDGSVRRLKGAGRPVVPATLRARLVGALEPVDAVVVFPEDTPEASISALQPDVHCKGAEYADGRPIPEAETVRAYGGRVEFLPLVEGVSTSAMLAALATPTEAADG